MLSSILRNKIRTCAIESNTCDRIRYAFGVSAKLSFHVHNKQHQTKNSSKSNLIRINQSISYLYSRRQTDALITQKRITIKRKSNFEADAQSNAERSEFHIAKHGDMIDLDLDCIYLDNKQVHPPPSDNHRTPASGSSVGQHTNNAKSIVNANTILFKYYKPKGIVCTTNRKIDNNIITHIYNTLTYQKYLTAEDMENIQSNRLFTIGRLDKNTTGLILLTNNGKLSHSLTTHPDNSSNVSYHSDNRVSTTVINKPVYKTYLVAITKPLSDKDKSLIEQGKVSLTTEISRPHGTKLHTSNIYPCMIRIPNSSTHSIGSTDSNKNDRIKNKGMTTTLAKTPLSDSYTVTEPIAPRNKLFYFELSICEGRKRQIRLLMDTLGYTIHSLHRIKFDKIDLRVDNYMEFENPHPRQKPSVKSKVIWMQPNDLVALSDRERTNFDM